jgi:hypothetical protein
MKHPTFCCEQMKQAVTEGEVAVVYLAKFREYGIRVLDGGTSYIELRYCPWCGHELPGSLRDQWFDELERRGIDPAIDDVPPEYSDERWYTSDTNK